VHKFSIEHVDFKFSNDDILHNFVVKSKLKDYDVRIVDESILDTVASVYSDGNIVLLDSMVYSLYFDQINAKIPPSDIFLVDAFEEKKTIETALKVIEFLNYKEFHKKNNLLVIGGGITQDIGSFVAACFKRGLSWTFLPTTLLAQCDSCIGSKSGLNYEGIKNQIGLFSPPDLIVINTNFLPTLTDEEVKSGLGEILKVYLMAGSSFFNFYDNHVTEGEINDFSIWPKLIMNSLVIKKQIIEFDELEHDTRRSLNYGHTVGHAVETLSDYKIPHGQAVALGIYASNEINNTNTDKMKSQLLSLISNKEVLKSIDYHYMKRVLISDKKSVDSHVMMVFVDPAIGESRLEYIDVDILISKIKKVISELY
jgi:3-dehydroquinate synthase